MKPKFYDEYVRQSQKSFLLGRIRQTPWYLRLLGRKPYRRWGARGVISIYEDPDTVWSGKWFYMDWPE